MKIEMHAHTKEASFCSHVTAEDAVRLYKDNGYDGMVITNHYCRAHIDAMPQASFHKFIDMHLNGYHIAQEAGEKIGMKIFFGIELCFDCAIPTDFLIYGIDESFLLKHPYINRMNIDSFLEILPENALVYQAHPFRNRMQITHPDRLFGIEVNNGNCRHDSRNDIAKAWAEKFNLHMISGSDFHETEDVGRGGLILNKQVNTMDELVRLLRTDDYKLITC